MSSATNQYYYLSSSSSSTTSSSSSKSTKTSDALDKSAESWKLPYSIEDEDLTFDGKPLNLLYEENRHHVMDERREHVSFLFALK
jgi:hypothetical protein